jgi:epoxyqueuosine reductase
MFGCDDCQTACPWNRSSESRTSAPLARRDDLDVGLDPADVLAMTEAEFRARYSGTALMRARWDGMRRNACVVLGNRADPVDVPQLSRVLRTDPDPVIRAHAAWALGRIADPAARASLAASGSAEADPVVADEIRAALRG